MVRQMDVEIKRPIGECCRGLEETEVSGARHSFSATRRIQLAKDIAQVFAHGVDGDDQRRRNLLIRCSLAHHAQYLFLTLSQWLN